MKLEDIGFYTLEDHRAENVDINTPLWRCELLLTSRCNFKCPYCRGMKKEDQGDLSLEDALYIVDLWGDMNLKNIRFSGGEPTLWKDLDYLVTHTKKRGIQRIALSTNGSAPLFQYKKLIQCGVNDISISLDSCCSTTGNKMTGGVKAWNKVIENIKELSKLTYVTVGSVLTEDNINEIDGIAKFAHDLGVADIRLITAAQTTKNLPPISYYDNQHPILTYRLNNIRKEKPIRGISESDCHKCSLVLDDMAVLNNKHYPCIIYLREGGKECGTISSNIREERYNWFLNHNCYKDPICQNNCLDVCVDYNNKVRELNKKLGVL